MYELSLDQSNDLIKNKELSTDIIGKDETVAIIFTQSWCSDWHSMERYLANEDQGSIYFYIYDKADNFDEFRKFKESVWDNDQVPYVRFYRQGKLISDCNYISYEQFRERIKQ